jgi:hypothetical protein
MKLSLKILIILIILLTILNISDILLTKEILRYGGAETNPEYLHFNTIGIQFTDCIKKIFYTILMGVVLYFLYWYSLRINSKIGLYFTFIILTFLNLLYIYIVYHNTQVLITQKQIWESLRQSQCLP